MAILDGIPAEPPDGRALMSEWVVVADQKDEAGRVGPVDMSEVGGRGEREMRVPDREGGDRLRKGFPIFMDVRGALRWYITLMSDILLRGVPESAVGVIKQEASERGVSPGEFITRVLNFYLLLSGPDVPPQVGAARQDSKLQREQP